MDNAYVVLRSASNSSQLEQVALYNQHFEHISTFPITLSREDRFNQILITQTGDVYLLFTENSERPKPYIVYLASEGSASPVRYNVPMESFPYHPGKSNTMQGSISSFLHASILIEERMKIMGPQD